MRRADIEANARAVLAVRNMLVEPLNMLQVQFSTGQIMAALLHLVAETIVDADNPAAAREAVVCALDASITFATHEKNDEPCAH